MKIRTQIALVFLLLAVVPMTAIVLYSYVSSLRTVREAVEAEAEVLTEEMETRMRLVRGDIRRRVERIGALPFRRWALEDETAAEREEMYDSVMAELGETAPLVDRFEFVPEFPGAGWKEASEVDPMAPLPPRESAPHPPAHPAPLAPVVIDVREMIHSVEVSLENLDPDSIHGIEKEDLIEHAKRGLEFAREKAEEFNLKAGRVVRIKTEADEVEELEQELLMAGAAAALAESAEAGDTGTSYRLLFREEMEVPVYEDGAMVGEIRAEVKNEELLRRVLDRTRRGSGEIPFAIDDQGTLYSVTDVDRARLAAIGLEAPMDRVQLGERQVLDNWVVVTSEDEETGLTFGIAKPIEESVAEMRATAIRNFAFGTGLIGLALLGVFPLSRRMTHGLHLVTEGAERVASGDLEARVPLRSKSEIGQLARAFNDMAQDLQENQQKLVEGERLQAEFERKTEELEEARRFQLSLLPKELPEHPSVDLGAVMRTATEVGGDYYDFRVADDGTLTIAIGDATGHGAKAGTMVTVVKSLFSAYPPTGDLAGFQATAAAAIKRMALGRMSMALTLARLTDGKLTVSAAGMPPILVHRSATGKVDEVVVEGMPLGGLDFVYRERSVPVESGDVVLLMSDGFPELPNRDGDTLGYERASRHFAAAGSNPDEVISHLLEEAESWAGETSPADDITFVVIRIR